MDKSKDHLVPTYSYEFFNIEDMYGDRIRETYKILEWYTGLFVKYLLSDYFVRTTPEIKKVTLLCAKPEKYFVVRKDKNKLIVEDTKVPASDSYLTLVISFLKQLLGLPFQIDT
jgi:hypothetical protein